MGNDEGFLKVMNLKENSTIKNLQVDTKTITDIKIPSFNARYKNYHSAFVLI